MGDPHRGGRLVSRRTDWRSRRRQAPSAAPTAEDPRYQLIAEAGPFLARYLASSKLPPEKVLVAVAAANHPLGIKAPAAAETLPSGARAGALPITTTMADLMRKGEFASARSILNAVMPGASVIIALAPGLPRLVERIMLIDQPIAGDVATWVRGGDA